MTELLKRAEQLDRKKIQPNWTSTAIRLVAVGEVARFHTCKITDNLELFDIMINAPVPKQDIEKVSQIILKALNEYQPTEQDYVNHMIEEGKIKS